MLGRLLPKIVRELSAYWEACVEPWWPRLDALLEADVIHRARGLARGGAAALFVDLGPNVSWSSGVLTLDFPWKVPFDEVDVAGQGLVMIPSCFVRRAVCAVSVGELPAITYPARGRATAWVSAAPTAPDALVGILGKVRSLLLVQLGTPSTTADLASFFGVTSSAISQHLSALHATRLVNRSREGRSVLYFRSPLGDELLG